MTNQMNVRELSISAVLATVSVVLQLMHIGYQVPQIGIWIDLVSISWIIALFLLGIHGAITTSIVGSIMITLFAPTSWFGAIMKWTTTMPMWLVLYLWLLCISKKIKYYEKIQNLIIPLIIALTIRIFIALPLNYYFALPIWMKITPTQAKNIVPWYMIGLLNIIQGTLEVTIAWLITFKFNLKNFANWNN